MPKVTPELLFALVKLAMQVPALAQDIRQLMSHSGVTDQQWEDAAHIIAQNPEKYFEGGTPRPPKVDPSQPDQPPQPKPPDPPNAGDFDDRGIYEKIVQTIPALVQLTFGDRIWMSPNGTLFYIRPNDSPWADSFSTSPGFKYYGWFDGDRIITAAEDPNDGKRTR